MVTKFNVSQKKMSFLFIGNVASAFWKEDFLTPKPQAGRWCLGVYPKHEKPTYNKCNTTSDTHA